MAMTLCKLLRHLILDLWVPIHYTIPLHCDSQATIHVSADLVLHKDSKHIEIDCHFIRYTFQTGFLTPSYILSASQPVDILTKALHPSSFWFLSRKLGIYDLPAPTYGGVLR